MTYRIKQSDLEYLTSVINTKKGFELPISYSEVGAYTLSYAYGGVSLHKYTNKSGVVIDVFRCGHVPKRELYNVPKRELYNRMQSYISGMEG